MDDNQVSVALDVGCDRARPHVCMPAQDRVAHIIVVWHLAVVEYDNVLQLHAVAYDTVRPYQSRPSYKRTMPDFGLLASFVLTLFWKKSRKLIAVHGALYLLLGLQFYMTWVPLLGDFWFWTSLGMWVLTIVLFICALRGYRIIEVKEAEGMNSIFPEQRLANAAENGSGAFSNEPKNESKCDTCKRAEQGDWYLCDMCKVGDTQYKSVDEPD